MVIVTVCVILNLLEFDIQKRGRPEICTMASLSTAGWVSQHFGMAQTRGYCETKLSGYVCGS